MDVLLTTAIAAGVLFVGVWLVSLPLRDASIVDLIWGVGFALLAWVAWWGAPDAEPARLLVPVLATVWGARLSLYLLYRNWGAGEDPRYVSMRRRHAPFWLKSLGIVFGLQAILQWLIALPLILLQRDAVGVGPWVAPGLALWAIGLVFETVADLQLARFKANPANAGQVLDRGLWRYSRHPNYFGDCLVWWGLFAVALALGAPWWTVFSPLLITGLLLKVSGVPLLESRLVRMRRDYADYRDRTPAFFPWKPRGSQ